MSAWRIVGGSEDFADMLKAPTATLPYTTRLLLLVEDMLLADRPFARLIERRLAA